MIVVGCNLFEWGTFLRRMDNFLIDLVAEPAKVEALLDALMERHMAALEQTCRAVGDAAGSGVATTPFVSCLMRAAPSSPPSLTMSVAPNSRASAWHGARVADVAAQPARVRRAVVQRVTPPCEFGGRPPGTPPAAALRAAARPVT